jgi:hypothetical protein
MLLVTAQGAALLAIYFFHWVVHADDLRLAVGDELFGLAFGKECHLRGSLVCGPKRSFHQTEGPRKSAAEPVK